MHSTTRTGVDSFVPIICVPLVRRVCGVWKIYTVYVCAMRSTMYGGLCNPHMFTRKKKGAGDSCAWLQILNMQETSHLSHMQHKFMAQKSMQVYVCVCAVLCQQIYYSWEYANACQACLSSSDNILWLGVPLTICKSSSFAPDTKSFSRNVIFVATNAIFKWISDSTPKPRFLPTKTMSLSYASTWICR